MKDSSLTFSTIPFCEWQVGIAPLWHMQGNAAEITPWINGHGQMQFIGREFRSRVLLFPVAAAISGLRVGWTSSYNISDSAVRIRGIYVDSEYRGLGIGRRMTEYSISLWPSFVNAFFIYARTSNVCRYKKWGFTVCDEFLPRSFELQHSTGEPSVTLMVYQR